MADKKKMSVAEILAAARKADGDGSAPASDVPPSDTSDAPSDTAAEAAPTQEEVAAPEKPAAKPAKTPGGKPSVADILAMARGQDGAAKQEKAAPKPKKAAPKPAAKKAPPKEAAKPAAAARTGPRDTASILAAIRKDVRPGPMSKAEAAQREKPEPETQKKKLEAPPMPVRPSYATRPAERPPSKAPAEADRRGFLNIGFAGLAAVGALWTLAMTRFMFPNVLREPPSRFKVGFPGDFAPGQVITKFKAQFGVWVVNAEYNGQSQIVALKSVCTHLGCTPNWLEAEQKFKCPCHGSGFYKEGINFEGPAPRPLERYAISVADDGQVEIDKSRIFQEEMGQWEDPSCFIPV